MNTTEELRQIVLEHPELLPVIRQMVIDMMAEGKENKPEEN